MDERMTERLDPGRFDWAGFPDGGDAGRMENWMPQELADRREDLAELGWLLSGIRRELELYREAFPDGRFELELEGAFARQTDLLQAQVDRYGCEPERCDMNAFLALKYSVRTLYKQLGAIVAGTDWQTPAKKLARGMPARTEEAGFAQAEHGTYMRSYGSETVKAHEAAAMAAYYSLTGKLSATSFGFAVSSGMKALELALVAYKSFTGETLPFLYQQGVYGEGADLAGTLLNGPVGMSAEAICAKAEAGEPIGGLLVDPGRCWPVRPAIDLGRLLEALRRYRQEQPLYVIVDRTLTGMTNRLFARYADKLPSHVMLIAVESGIKYLEYGFDLANVGYVAASGGAAASRAYRDKWIDLLALLDAGADPVAVRQLPAPDSERLTARLIRLNRNAEWMDAFLGLLKREGKIADYFRSVEPSEQYMLHGRPWLGSVFYICLPGFRSEREYERWIDDFVEAAPADAHFVSGGSFGFDTFRMNAVSDATGNETALRVSVGRDPIGQLLGKLNYIYGRL